MHRDDIPQKPLKHSEKEAEVGVELLSGALREWRQVYLLVAAKASQQAIDYLSESRKDGGLQMIKAQKVINETVTFLKDLQTRYTKLLPIIYKLAQPGVTIAEATKQLQGCLFDPEKIESMVKIETELKSIDRKSSFFNYMYSNFGLLNLLPFIRWGQESKRIFSLDPQTVRTLTELKYDKWTWNELRLPMGTFFVQLSDSPIYYTPSSGNYKGLKMRVSGVLFSNVYTDTSFQFPENVFPTKLGETLIVKVFLTHPDMKHGVPGVMRSDQADKLDRILKGKVQQRTIVDLTDPFSSPVPGSSLIRTELPRIIPGAAGRSFPMFGYTNVESNTTITESPGHESVVDSVELDLATVAMT